MNLDAILRGIISNIPSQRAFDSHYVIRELLRVDSDAYIRFVSAFAAGPTPTLTAHQQIGLAIDAFAQQNPSLLVRLPYQSHSFNIREHASECALWQRL